MTESATSVGSRSDRILGVLGAAMIIIAALLLLFGAAEDDVAPTPPSDLRLLYPSSHSLVENPPTIVFESDADLTRQPGGWGAGGFHVHAEVNGREMMPGPSDIRANRGGDYSWSLPALPEGEMTVRLFWSDADHRPIEGGASETVVARVAS